MARYNAVALRVMGELGVPVHDLHRVVRGRRPGGLLSGDGTHYTPEGYALLAEAVADCVRRALTVHRYRSREAPRRGRTRAPRTGRTRRSGTARCRPPTATSPGASSALRRTASPGPPGARTCWPEVLQSLGDLPPIPRPPAPGASPSSAARGTPWSGSPWTTAWTGRSAPSCCCPRGCTGPSPAVLWLHSSTPDKTQIITPGHQRGTRNPWARPSSGAGYAVFAPDAYWHGDRAGTGPAGALETGRAEQESLLKLHLWMGRTLWGMFVRDDQIALDYLCPAPGGRPGADRRHRHEHGQHPRLVAGRRGRARRRHGRPSPA